MNNLARKSVVAVIWNFAGGGGRALAQILIQTVLARILGPEVFGQFAIVLAIFSIGWLLADGGFGATLVQKEKIDDQDISNAIACVLLTAVVLSIGIYFSAEWISTSFKNEDLIDVVKVTAILIFLQALTNIPSSLMRRNLDAKRIQIIQLTGYVFSFGVVGIFLAKNEFGIWSLVIAFLLQTIISLVSMYLCVQHTLRPRFNDGGKIGKFGLSVVGVNVVNWAIENVDRLLVGRIWGVASLGQYSVALNLSRAPVSILVAAVQSVAFSSASKIQNDAKKIKKGYLLLMSIAMLIVLPTFTFFYISSNFIILNLYGASWGGATLLFKVFLICMPFYIMVSLTGPILWSLGIADKELYAQLAVLCLMIIGFLLLSSRSLYDAVWFVPLLYFFRAMLVIMALIKKIKIKTVDLVGVFAGGFVFSIVVALISNVLEQFGSSGALGEIYKIFLCAVGCFIVTYLSRGRVLGGALLIFLNRKKRHSGNVRKIFKFIGR